MRGRPQIGLGGELWLARASKPDGYRLGSYRMAIAPESNSGRFTSFKSTCFDSPANKRGPVAREA